VSVQKNIAVRKKRRAFRVKNSIKGKGLRVSVFRSLKQIYAQIIDDVSHKTLVSFSSHNLSKKVGNKKDIAKQVGKELAALAKSKSISSVCFDRGSYKYHGRVAALADGLREGGLAV
jgi:large subunit ribosomal protein L18